MSELLVDFITSLDGCGAAEGWPGWCPDVALDMIRTRTFDGRTQLLEYTPTVLSGPPSTNTGGEQ